MSSIMLSKIHYYFWWFCNLCRRRIAASSIYSTCSLNLKKFIFQKHMSYFQPTAKLEKDNYWPWNERCKDPTNLSQFMMAYLNNWNSMAISGTLFEMLIDVFFLHVTIVWRCSKNIRQHHSNYVVISVMSWFILV